MSTRTIAAKVLMAFALVSIGFAAGKESGRRSWPSPGTALPGIPAAPRAIVSPEDANQPADKVIVYYMHTTFRCLTCNRIESQAEAVVKGDFADALAAGRVEWKALNFQEHDDLAARYGVGTSTVVVVKVRGGREVAHRRLDEVWTKVGDADAFSSYVGQAIREMLAGGGA